MKKSTIIALMFSSIIITLVFTVMSYYGVFRYFNLHRNKCEQYAGKYNDLQKAEEKGKILVVLTTTEDNIDKIQPTINSLFDQTVSVDEISLAVPYKMMGKIPDDVKNSVWLHNFSKDYGELNAVIPPLLKMEDNDDIIIIVNDNIVYGRDFIEEMLDKHKKHDTIIFGKYPEKKYGVLLQPKYINSGYQDWEGKDFYTWLKKFSDKKSLSIDYEESYGRW